MTARRASDPTRVLLYTMDEAAEMLRIKRRRLQMLLHDYPFYRMIGRRKLFTHGDIEKIIEALPRPGELRTMKSARGFDRLPPSEAKLWERAREQMTPPPRKRKSGHQKKPQAREGVVNLDKARARRSRTRPPGKGQI